MAKILDDKHPLDNKTEKMLHESGIYEKPIRVVDQYDIKMAYYVQSYYRSFYTMVYLFTDETEEDKEKQDKYFIKRLAYLVRTHYERLFLRPLLFKKHRVPYNFLLAAVPSNILVANKEKTWQWYKTLPSHILYLHNCPRTHKFFSELLSSDDGSPCHDWNYPSDLKKEAKDFTYDWFKKLPIKPFKDHHIEQNKIDFEKLITMPLPFLAVESSERLNTETW